MGKKSERLAVIRRLIETETVSSQEELLARLRKQGIEATQSTLSRDIKELKAVKIPDGRSGYLYVMPEAIRGVQPAERTPSVVTDNILSVDFSGNIAVMKTNPGYANAVAVLIDNEYREEVMGTIAGDDTIFIVMREGTSRARLLESLAGIHPEIGTLYKPTSTRRRIFK